VENVLKDYYGDLKGIFLALASRSGFPCINWLMYSDYVKMCEIIDENVNLSAVDRAFIATNVEIEKSDSNPATALQRHEWLEIIVRLADVKFKQPGICATHAEAVKKLIDEHILRLGGMQSLWQPFRAKELWTLAVNDILEANLALLKKVYEAYYQPRKQIMVMRDAIQLMMKDGGVDLNEKDAMYVYGMSKMTVEREGTQSDKYNEMKFVEMLEMIGRMAEMKYRHSGNKDMPLATKISFILDLILPAVLEKERIEVDIQIEEESESDEDY